MKNHLHILLFVLVMSTSSYAQGPVIMEKSLKLTDGSKLLYTISQPEGLKRNKTCPLIIALHWGWDKDKVIPDFFSKSFLSGLIIPAFKQSGAIIVAPDCPSEKWHNEESENAILELMDHIKSKFVIDSGQVFITGFSAGGFGTWYMASRHPELFSMAVPMASKPYALWIEEWPDVPVFMVNGTLDELFPFGEVKEIAEKLEDKNIRVKLITVEGATHYDTYKYITPLKYSLRWFKEQ